MCDSASWIINRVSKEASESLDLKSSDSQAYKLLSGLLLLSYLGCGII